MKWLAVLWLALWLAPAWAQEPADACTAQVLSVQVAKGGDDGRRPEPAQWQAVELPEGILRGHTYHHSLTSTALEPLARGLSPNGGRGNEAVYRLGRLTASYVHFYFPSNPEAAAALLCP